MTQNDYLTTLLQAYSLLSVLSDKNESKVLKVKNKITNQLMVVRSFPTAVTAYEELYRIQFPHLPLIYDVISLEDGQVVLEEFIDGITVSQVMESGNYRYWGIRHVLRCVCQALQVLHGKNLVHRDIKPENIVIGKDGRVVLIDFNASRKLSAAKKDTIVMGTVGYASPEQLGLAQSDARTDIYAMGVLLNVMLTGKHPSETLAKGKAGKIVRKCTNVHPDERYQSVQELMAAL